MKKILIFVFLFHLFYIPLVSSEIFDISKVKFFKLNKFKFSAKDLKENYRTDLDDSDWEVYHHVKNDSLNNKVLWIRMSIEISGQLKDKDNIVISFHNFSPAYEVYWDEEKVGADGIISIDGSLKTPGKVRYSIPLSAKMISKGIHKLSIRQYFKPSVFAWTNTIHLASGNALKSYLDSNKDEYIFHVGFLLVVTFFCISLYFTGTRNLSYLYFGLYAGFFCFANLWSYFVDIRIISITFFRILEPILRNSDGIYGMLPVLFLLWHFDIKPKKNYFLILVFLLFASIALAVFPNANPYILDLFKLIPFNILGIIISIKGVKKKIPGAIILLLTFPPSFSFFLSTFSRCYGHL